MGRIKMSKSVDGTKLKKYTPPEIKEVWDEQIGTRGVYLLELG